MSGACHVTGRQMCCCGAAAHVDLLSVCMCMCACACTCVCARAHVCVVLVAAQVELDNPVPVAKLKEIVIKTAQKLDVSRY